MPTAVFRLLASDSIGGGHLVRCRALAEELKGRGWVCRFVVNPEASSFLPAVLAGAFETLVIEDENDAARQLNDGSADIAVLDMMNGSRDEDRIWRALAMRLMVIDDVGSSPREADLLLDQNFGRDEATWRPLVPAGCRCLIGGDYALLRGQFAQARRNVVPDLRNFPPAAIFVSLGMTDPLNLTGRVLEGIEQSALAPSVTVLLGAQAPHLETLQSRCFAMPVHFAVGVDQVATLLANADLAIGAPGVGAWERCTQGVGSLLIVWAKNQEGNAAGLALEGAARLVGRDDVTPSSIATALRDLKSQDVRAMANAAYRLCDGQGRQRVADEIETLILDSKEC